MWDEDDDNETVPTDEVNIGTDRRVDKQFIIEKGLHCLLLPLILWHSVFHLSNGAGNSLMKSISAFLHILPSCLTVVLSMSVNNFQLFIISLALKSSHFNESSHTKHFCNKPM